MIPIEEHLVDVAIADPYLVDLESKSTLALSNIWILKHEFSGMQSREKIFYVRQKMKENSCDCYIVTALDEIAWLLNGMMSLPS
jgi:Creatinase/Prolidase N-terminal domain